MAGALAIFSFGGTRLGDVRAPAFRSPTYRGEFESVPWVIDAVEEALGQAAEVEPRLRTLARNVYEMYQRIDELPPPFALAQSDVTILHVTDFHNHPAAATIARELAEAFAVDFAVNTGDLTDFGTLIEAELLRGLEEFPVPHFLVTGNHETPEIVGALSLAEGVRIIDGQFVEAAGLRLLGIGDPGAAVYPATSLTPAQARRMADEINHSFEGMSEPPDMLAVHNHRVGTGIRPGSLPLVLFGHSHTPGVVFRGGTAYVNAGTTGGAGVRGFEAEEPVRISLAVIYLQRREQTAGHRRRPHSAFSGGRRLYAGATPGAAALGTGRRTFGRMPQRKRTKRVESTPMSSKLRMFVAISVAEATRQSLRAMQQALRRERVRRQVDPRRPISRHSEVFGRDRRLVGRSRRRTTKRAVSGWGPFSMSFRGVGAFPALEAAACPVVSCRGRPLSPVGFATQVEAAFAGAGFPSSGRPFRPHLTLGRVRAIGPGVDLAKLQRVTSTYEAGPERVERVVVYRSRLTPQGPIYTEIESLPLEKRGVDDSK